MDILPEEHRVGPAPVQRRICSVCQTSKIVPGEMSWPQARRPTAAKCRDCQRDYHREYQRKRRADRPEVVRRSNLWRLYRIREADYDALRAAQSYRCAICQLHEDEIDTSTYGGRPRSDGTRTKPFALCVDHDHATGRIRGLLCRDCNSLIGLAREDAKRLQSAVRYLMTAGRRPSAL